LNKAQGEIKDQYLNARLARETLGWSARVKLAEGLVQTFAWYQDLLGERNA
jgi:CDP-glucose 4,6-dehydratase